MSGNIAARWFRDCRGATAVEFAQIAIPFIFMIVAIIELALFFAAANMLESSVNESARLIRTGQLQKMTERPHEEIFREAICGRLMVLVDCNNVDLEVVAIEGTNFSQAYDLEPVYDEYGRMVPREFSAGGADDIVLVRVAYRYQLRTPIFSNLFSREEDKTIPLLSTVVMRTEPYEYYSN